MIYGMLANGVVVMTELLRRYAIKGLCIVALIHFPAWSRLELDESTVGQANFVLYLTFGIRFEEVLQTRIWILPVQYPLNDPEGYLNDGRRRGVSKPFFVLSGGLRLQPFDTGIQCCVAVLSLVASTAGESVIVFVRHITPRTRCFIDIAVFIICIPAAFVNFWIEGNEYEFSKKDETMQVGCTCIIGLAAGCMMIYKNHWSIF